MVFNTHQWYLNGLKPNLLIANVLIGGVASVIATPADLAGRISLLESQILNFRIQGDDIVFSTEQTYSVLANGFANVMNIMTYYRDMGGYCNDVGPGAFSSAGIKYNVKYFMFYGALTIGSQAFRYNGGVLVTYIGKCLNIGGSVGKEYVWDHLGTPAGMKIYVEPSQMTCNAGGLDGDLAYAASVGGSSAVIIPVTNYTKPNEITNLQVTFQGETYSEIAWEVPITTIPILHYEVYIDDIYYKTVPKEFTNTNLTELSAYSEHKVIVRTFDEFYNFSESNPITVKQIGIDEYPTNNFILYYKYDILNVSTTIYDNALMHNGTLEAAKIPKYLTFGQGYGLNMTPVGTRIRIAHNSDLNMSDGVNDLPKTIAFKRRFSSGAGGFEFNKEGDYRVQFSSGYMYVTFYDKATGATDKLQVRTTNIFVNNVDYSVVITYDGSKSVSGIIVVINGVVQTLINTSTGIYTGMPNLSNRLTLGYDNAFANGINGIGGSPMMLNINLTESQAIAVSNKLALGYELIN